MATSGHLVKKFCFTVFRAIICDRQFPEEKKFVVLKKNFLYFENFQNFFCVLLFFSFVYCLSGYFVLWTWTIFGIFRVLIFWNFLYWHFFQQCFDPSTQNFQDLPQVVRRKPLVFWSRSGIQGGHQRPFCKKILGHRFWCHNLFQAISSRKEKLVITVGMPKCL